MSAFFFFLFHQSFQEVFSFSITIYSTPSRQTFLYFHLPARRFVVLSRSVFCSSVAHVLFFFYQISLSFPPPFVCFFPSLLWRPRHVHLCPDSPVRRLFFLTFGPLEWFFFSPFSGLIELSAFFLFFLLDGLLLLLFFFFVLSYLGKHRLPLRLGCRLAFEFFFCFPF